VRIITPYVEAFKLAIHEAIPWRSRHFDWDTKTWIVRQPFVNDALEIAHQHFDRMDELRPANGQTEGSPSSASSSSSAGHGLAECLGRVRGMYREESEVHLLPDAPLPVVPAAYRAMALLVHPDRGGSHEQMVAVNKAYEILRRRAEGRVGP